ncbi:transcriptional regulator, LacI family [Kordiimonas lacus]|uniref:Transcriptional regulator, LacI family n=1 Tax=Kordiimonas lacus TaxID=637679 RepID=A0A1G6YQU2_9PROT|nr:transcriptional regulator, LacI family [Kordiimonas lacus]
MQQLHGRIVGRVGLTQKPPIKMADLAKLAGVSKSTVSRALADSPLIPQETKQKIAALAKEHNYRLNKRARNFRTKETLTIAVLIPDTREKDWRLSDPFFLELLGSIADTLNDQNHELLLAKSSVSAEEWARDHIERGTCDGVILVGQGTQHEEINKLAEGSTPFVVWGGLLDGQHYCTVGSDNRLGGKKASSHLIERGRRYIAFLGDRRLPEVALRYAGYQDALAAAGLDVDASLEVVTPFGGEAAYRAVADFLDSGQAVDGIFACSDVIAMATIRALRERGLSIPEDVAIVGYDDIALSSYYSPPLTTVRQDCQRGGQELVSRLLEIIQGGKPAPLMLDTEIVERAST